MRRWNALWIAPILLMAGCMGGGKSADINDDATKVVVPTTSASNISKALQPENLPKYHPHDLWGDRASIVIFDAKLPIGQDPADETAYRDGVFISGYTEFDPRTDGDDSSSIDKADVVFQGTKALVAKLSWSSEKTESQIPGITFLYKPANSARFTAVENVPNGAEVFIPLSKGWADMPHQLKLSRWRFAIQAFDPAVASAPVKTYAAHGSVSILIQAINGGEKSIDPPHPYNFLESTTRPAGELKRYVDALVVSSETTGTLQAQGEPTRGWQVEPPYIVPWETTKLHAKLYYNYTGQASAAPHELALRYTDASGPEVKIPKAAATGAGFAIYDIPVLATEADDPYATHSDWTWGVQPLVNGQEAVGEFKGDVHLVLTAEGTSEAMS